VADRLDALERNASDHVTMRATPSSALEDGLAVVGREHELGDRLRVRAALGRQARELGARVRGELERLVQAGDGGRREPLENAVPVPRGGGWGETGVRSLVGQRQQHARERAAVRDAVVHSHDQRGAVAVPSRT
jgi:hypothetical protein